MLVLIAVLVIVVFFLLPVPPLAQTSGEDMILVLGWFLVFLAACVILASFFKVLQDWSEVKKKKEEFHQQLQRMKMLEADEGRSSRPSSPPAQPRSKPDLPPACPSHRSFLQAV